MTTWKLKGCPRCGGDMFLNESLDSWYEQCLQCSYQRDLKDVAEFKEQPAQQEKEPDLVGANRSKRHAMS